MSDNCPQCDEHDDLCVACLHRKIASLEAEIARTERPLLATQIAFERHAVHMRDDVAPAICNFLAGLVKNGLDLDYALPLAQQHLAVLLMTEEPPC